MPLVQASAALGGPAAGAEDALESGAGYAAAWAASGGGCGGVAAASSTPGATECPWLPVTYARLLSPSSCLGSGSQEVEDPGGTFVSYGCLGGCEPLLGIADGLVGGPGALEVGVKGGQLGAHAPGQSSQHPTDVAGLGLLARTWLGARKGLLRSEQPVVHWADPSRCQCDRSLPCPLASETHVLEAKGFPRPVSLIASLDTQTIWSCVHFDPLLESV